jgi:hypothetical protein
MKINTHFLILLAAVLALSVALSACGGSGEPDATATPRPLTIWDYEDVCRQGTISGAAAYDGAAGQVHPLVLFERDSADETSYDSMTNTLLELPVPWVVEYDGDPTSVELVACITRVSEEFVETCEFGDEEEPDKVYYLNVHNASYEVKLIAATTGEEVASTTVDATYENCPMFHMFSDDELEEDTYAYLEGGPLQAFLEEFVAP